MKEWLRKRLKNKYIKASLVVFSVGLIALCFGAPFNAVFSSWLIIFWLVYIFSIIKRSSILSAKEKTIAYLIFLLLSVIMLGTVCNFKDFLKFFKDILVLLLPLSVRSDVAIVLWFKKKTVLATALACASMNTISLMVIYITTGLLKTHVHIHSRKLFFLVSIISKEILKHSLINEVLKKIKKFAGEKNLRNVLLEIKEVGQEIYKWRMVYQICLKNWVANRELWWLLAIFALPLPIPYLSTIIIVWVRYRNFRYGLWWLMALNFVKSMIFVWLVWQGIIIIT